MKKFVKVSLIVAGILTALGAVFCLISAIAGGGSVIHYIRNDEYMEARLEAVEKVLDNVDSGWDYVVFDKDKGRLVVNGENNSSNSDELEVNKERVSEGGYENHLSAENIKNLDITLGAGSFVIKEKDALDGTIDLYVQGKGKCDYYVKDGTLYIEGFKGLKVIGIGDPENCITLCLPAGLEIKEADIEIGAGIMEISSVWIRELDTAVGAGELSLYNMEVREFSTEIGAGRIDAVGMKIKDADIAVNMGEFVLEGAISGDLDAECDMGNLEMKLKGRETDHNYSIECSAGNINLGDFSISALAAEKEINNGAGSSFDIDCNMGNINISFEE